MKYQQALCNMEYYIDPTTRYPAQDVKTKPEICSTAMHVFEQALNPNGTPARVLQNAVIISLDLEYSHSLRAINQIGIATLDTHAISRLGLDDDDNIIKEVIARRLILIEHDIEPPHQHSRPYLFGLPESISPKPNDLRSILIPILTPLDSMGRTRNVILVGHGIRLDIESLKKFTDIDLSSLPSIKAIVDTSTMAGFTYDAIYFKYSSLKTTCNYLGLEAKHFHNAGNDAFFTLLASLLLFHYYKSEKLRWTFFECASNDVQLHQEKETDADAKEPVSGNRYTEDERLLWECQLETLRRIGRASYINTVIQKQEKRPRPVSVLRNDLGEITEGIVELFNGGWNS